MLRNSDPTMPQPAFAIRFKLKLCLCFASVATFIFPHHASGQSMNSVQNDASSEKVSFDAVQPILRKHCERCHNEDQPRGDLVLTSLDKVLAGSSSGNVVVAGKLEESPLYLLTAHLDTPKMPPNKPRIPQRELNLIERWIVTGLVEETQASTAKTSLAEPAKKPMTPDKEATGVSQSSVNSAKVLGPLGPIPQPTAVRAIAAHPTDPIVAVAGLHQVAILNADSARFEEQAIEVGKLDVSAMRFSPDGKLLLIAVGMIGESGTVRVLDWQAKRWLPSVGDESDNIQALDCNADASQVAIGTTTRQVKVFDRLGQKELFTHRKHTDWVLSVAFSGDGILLASGDRFGGIHLWETDSGNEFATLRGHTGGITGLIWSRDGNELTSSSLDGTVRVWNMHKQQVERQWLANERGVLSLAMDSENCILTSGRDGWVRKWDAADSSLKWQVQLPDEATAICNSATTPRTLIGADAAGGIFRFGCSVTGTSEPVENVLVVFPSNQQKRIFTASVPIAPKRIPLKLNELSDLSVVDDSPIRNDPPKVMLFESDTALLTELEESRRALSSVEQSLEQTYQSAERLEESVARLKQLIILQEVRLKQFELKQRPNRK